MKIELSPDFKKELKRLAKKYHEIKEAHPNRINYYLFGVFIVGLIGIATYRSIADRDIETADYSTFSNMLTGLGIISAIVLLYEKGFKKQYLIYFGVLIVFDSPSVNSS